MWSVSSSGRSDLAIPYRMRLLPPASSSLVVAASLVLALADVSDVAASTGAAPAPTVRLRNGVEMPLVAEGTWQYWPDEAAAAVSTALRSGFRMVDTAWDYNNQEGVGRGIRNSSLPRKEVFVETKVPGCGLDKSVGISHCYNDTVRILGRDLELLGLDYVDLVIIHFPPIGALVTRSCGVACGQVRQQWKALEEFYVAGKARAIGVSNYCPSCFACLKGHATVFPMVNQIGYHIGMGPDPSGFKSFAEQHGMVLQAYSPLGNTPWRKGPNKEILSGNLTTRLAATHGKTTIQIALKYIVQRGVAVVTKSSNPEHLAQDLDLFSWNLTDSELAEADALHLPGLPSFACSRGAAVGDEEAEAATDSDDTDDGASASDAAEAAPIVV